MTPKMLEALRKIGPNGHLTQVHRSRHNTTPRLYCANRVLSNRINGAVANALLRGGYVEGTERGGMGYGGGLDYSDYQVSKKGRAALASEKPAKDEA